MALAERARGERDPACDASHCTGAGSTRRSTQTRRGSRAYEGMARGIARARLRRRPESADGPPGPRLHKRISGKGRPARLKFGFYLRPAAARVAYSPLAIERPLAAPRTQRSSAHKLPLSIP